MKGPEIYFVSGKYVGKTGWLDLSEEADDETTPVIVDLKKKGEEKVTFVYNDNWKRKPTTNPTYYAEAVIQQCPDVEVSLVSTARKLAKCDIGRDLEGFNKVITTKIHEAVDWQKKKGSKAMYRKIKYP